MEETKKEYGIWECNTCGTRDGVENGICPKCTATQTTPIDDLAKKIAGCYIEPTIETKEEDKTSQSQQR